MMLQRRCETESFRSMMSLDSASATPSSPSQMKESTPSQMKESTLEQLLQERSALLDTVDRLKRREANTQLRLKCLMDKGVISTCSKRDAASVTDGPDDLQLQLISQQQDSSECQVLSERLEHEQLLRIKTERSLLKLDKEKARLENIRADYNQLKADVERKDHELEILQREARELEEGMNKLEKTGMEQKRRYEKEVEDYKLTIETLESQRRQNDEEHQDTLVGLRRDCDVLRQQIKLEGDERIENEVARKMKVSTRELELRLFTIQREREDCNNVKRVLESKLVEVEEEQRIHVGELKSELEETRTQQEQFSTALREIEGEKKKVEERIVAMQQEKEDDIALLEAQITNLTSELAQLQHVYSNNKISLESTADFLTLARDELSAERSITQQRLTDAHRELTSVVESTKQSMTEKQGAMEQLQERFASLTKTHNEEIEVLKQSHMSQLQEERSLSAAQASELSREIARMREVESQVGAKEAQLCGKIANLEDSFVRMQSFAEKQSALHQEVSHILGVLTKNCARGLRKPFNLVPSSASELARQLAELIARIVDNYCIAQSQCEELSTEISHARAKVEKERTENAELKSSLEEVEKERTCVVQEWARKEKTHQQTKDALHAEKEAQAERLNGLLSAERTSREKVENEAARAKNEIVEEKHKRERLEQELAERELHWAEQAQVCRKEIFSLECRLTERETCARLEGEMLEEAKERITEVADLRFQLKEAQTRLKQEEHNQEQISLLQYQLSERETQISDAASKTLFSKEESWRKSMLALETRLQQGNEEIASLKSQLCDLEQKYEKLVEHSEKLQRNLQDKISKEESTRKSRCILETKLKEREEEITNLESKLGKLEAESEELAQDSEKIERSLHVQRTKEEAWKKSRCVLETRLKERGEEIASLQLKLGEVEAKNEELEEEILRSERSLQTQRTNEEICETQFREKEETWRKMRCSLEAKLKEREEAFSTRITLQNAKWKDREANLTNAESVIEQLKENAMTEVEKVRSLEEKLREHEKIQQEMEERCAVYREGETQLRAYQEQERTRKTLIESHQEQYAQTVGEENALLVNDARARRTIALLEEKCKQLEKECKHSVSTRSTETPDEDLSDCETAYRSRADDSHVLSFTTLSPSPSPTHSLNMWTGTSPIPSPGVTHRSIEESDGNEIIIGTQRPVRVISLSPGTRYENEGIERSEMRALREALVTLEKKQQLGESEQRTLRAEKQELLDALKVKQEQAEAHEKTQKALEHEVSAKVVLQQEKQMLSEALEEKTREVLEEQEKTRKVLEQERVQKALKQGEMQALEVQRKDLSVRRKEVEEERERMEEALAHEREKFKREKKELGLKEQEIKEEQERAFELREQDKIMFKRELEVKEREIKEEKERVRKAFELRERERVIFERDKKELLVALELKVKEEQERAFELREQERVKFNQEKREQQVKEEEMKEEEDRARKTFEQEKVKFSQEKQELEVKIQEMKEEEERARKTFEQERVKFNQEKQELEVEKQEMREEEEERARKTSEQEKVKFIQEKQELEVKKQEMKEEEERVRKAFEQERVTFNQEKQEFTAALELKRKELAEEEERALALELRQKEVEEEASEQRNLARTEQRKLSDVLQQKQDTISNLEGEQSELERVQLELTEEIIELKLRSSSELKEEKLLAKTRLEQKEAEKQGLMDDLKVKEAQVSVLEKERTDIATKQSEMKETLEESVREVASLRHEKEENENRFAALQRDMNSVMHALDRRHVEYEEKSNAFEKAQEEIKALQEKAETALQNTKIVEEQVQKDMQQLEEVEREKKDLKRSVKEFRDLSRTFQKQVLVEIQKRENSETLLEELRGSLENMEKDKLKFEKLSERRVDNESQTNDVDDLVDLPAGSCVNTESQTEVEGTDIINFDKERLHYETKLEELHANLASLEEQRETTLCSAQNFERVAQEERIVAQEEALICKRLERAQYHLASKAHSATFLETQVKEQQDVITSHETALVRLQEELQRAQECAVDVEQLRAKESAWDETAARYESNLTLYRTKFTEIVEEKTRILAECADMEKRVEEKSSLLKEECAQVVEVNQKNAVQSQRLEEMQKTAARLKQRLRLMETQHKEARRDAAEQDKIARHAEQKSGEFEKTCASLRAEIESTHEKWQLEKQRAENALQDCQEVHQVVDSLRQESELLVLQLRGEVFAQVGNTAAQHLLEGDIADQWAKQTSTIKRLKSQIKEQRGQLEFREVSRSMSPYKNNQNRSSSLSNKENMEAENNTVQYPESPAPPRVARLRTTMISDKPIKRRVERSLGEIEPMMLG